VEVVALLSQGRTAAAQCGLFTYKSVPVIFEPPCILINSGYKYRIYGILSLRGEVYRVRANTRILNLVLTFTYVASHF